MHMDFCCRLCKKPDNAQCSSGSNATKLGQKAPEVAAVAAVRANMQCWAATYT